MLSIDHSSRCYNIAYLIPMMAHKIKMDKNNNSKLLNEKPIENEIE